MNETNNQNKRYRPLSISGLGGVGAGNGFHEHPDSSINAALEAAWDSGVRYFDTLLHHGMDWD